MPTLEADRLTLAYDRVPVVEDLSLRLPEGGITAIVGSNGSGKSTILKALGRVLRPRRGTVTLDGRDLQTLPTRAVARSISFLPQTPTAPDGLSVYELVSYGRFPHHRGLGGLGATDHEAIRRALEEVALGALAERSLGELSGGQRQCAWMAMTLAQETGILLLDEPTKSLDLAHQIEVLETLRALEGGGRRTIVVVLHDLNLAARYADRIIAIRAGRVVADGSPARVMDPETIRGVFGVEARILSDPSLGVPVCIAYPERGTRRRV